MVYNLVMARETIKQNPFYPFNNTIGCIECLIMFLLVDCVCVTGSWPIYLMHES